MVSGAVLLAALSVSDYVGYRNLKAMRGELNALREQVHETAQMAQQESTAVAASSRSAEEAAARAALAAEQRQQAESGRQQAEAAAQQAHSGQQQAQAAAQQADEQARQAQAKMTEMQRERDAELNRMQEALNRVAETRRTPNGMVILLPNSIFRFAFDKADLNEKNRELLSRIAGIFLASKGYGLSIYGYTDDVGTADYNQQLSLRRAEAVKDYLVQAGVDRDIVNVKGYGKTSPRVEGSSNEARASNRRVEIAVTDSSIRFQ